MKFDVVISNPPYNKGMDLDFIDIGYHLSSKYTAMLVPAKWQTAENNHVVASTRLNYGTFRKYYIKHMREVVFYPLCRDIFDIMQVDGITYFILTKDDYDKSIVINKCKHIEYFNSVELRNISHRESLINIGNEIVEYLGNYTKFTFRPTSEHDKFQVWTNIKIPGGGFATMESPRKNLFIGESYIEEYDPEIPLEHAPSLILSFSSDKLVECESFLSWLNCKFTRFFTAINTSKLTGILNNDNFRLVPAPPSGKFDHIYTDSELYESFNIPDKYINIIESIVKDRK